MLEIARDSQDLELAERNCKTAFNIKRVILGDTHEEVIEIQLLLGQIISMNDPIKAEKMFFFFPTLKILLIFLDLKVVWFWKKRRKMQKDALKFYKCWQPFTSMKI